MNKVYLTVWNELRGCYVVAHEKTASRGKASSSRTVVASAVLATLGAMTSLDAVSRDLCTTTTITTATTTLQDLGVNCLSVTGSGSIIVGAGAAVTQSTLVTSAGVTNAGTIQGATYGIYAGTEGGVINTVTNSGTISGGTYGIYADGPLGGQINTITNQTGGLIDGGLRIQGAGNATVTNAGTIVLPAGHTSTITGDYFNTGTLRTNVSAMGTFGKLSVTGAVALGGTLEVNVIGSPTLTNGGTLADVVQSTSTGQDEFSVTFATVSDNSTLFDFTAVSDYDRRTVSLTVVSASTTGVLDSVISQGNNPAAGAASAWDSIIASSPRGELGTIVTALGALTSNKQVSDAVSQTLPLHTGGQSQTISSSLRTISQIVQEKQENQENLSGLSSGDEVVESGKLWIKPFGSVAEQDDRSGVSGYRSNTYGVIVGADGEVNSDNRFGMAFAASSSRVDGKSSVAPQTSTVTTYNLVAYGSQSLDENTHLNYQADLGTHINKGNRTIALNSSVAEADYNSLSAHLGGGLGRTMKIDEQTNFIPSVRADYTQVRDNGYTETGAGVLNLVVSARQTDELILSADGKVTHRYDEQVQLTANLGVGYDTLNKQTSITSAFAGAPGVSFTTNGLNPSPWLLRGGLGVVSVKQNGMELTARYDVEGRESFINQTASVKARWAF